MEALPPPHVLVAQLAKLRGEVQRHKFAIKTHREQLQRSAADLAHLEAACRARGIGITTVPVAHTQPIEAQE